jgi:SAM-dependent methyltransferase
MTPFARSAGVYDLVYARKDYAREIAVALERLRVHGVVPRTWLDVGCGTGRHAEALAAAGISVIGIDRSPAMVTRAMERGVDARVGDVTELRLDERFTVVSALFHVVSYLTTLEDLRAALRAVRTHLTDDGAFFFDAWWAPAAMRTPPSVRVAEHRDGARVLTRTATPAIMSPHTWDVRLGFDLEDGDSTERWEESHPMRAFDGAELRSALTASGMELIELRAAFTVAPPTDETFSVHVIARPV